MASWISPSCGNLLASVVGDIMTYMRLVRAMRELERALTACDSGDCKCSGDCGCSKDKQAESTDGYFGPSNTMNDFSYGGDFAHTSPDNYVDNPDYNRKTVTPPYGRETVYSKRRR